MPLPLPNAAELKKTVPGQPKEVLGLKRFYPLSLRRTDKGWQVQIYWGRLLLSFVLLACLGWIGTMSAAYAFVKYQRGVTELRYVDMLLLPLHWRTYQVTRGDASIRTAQEQLKAQKYREAFTNLRIGVAKSPANKEGRMLLIQFYSVWRRPDLAKQTLLEGLPYHQADKNYLKLLFSYLLQQQDDEQVISLAKDLLKEDRALTERNQLIALASASASFFRGNYDRTEDILHVYGLENTRDGRLLSARMEWERGRKDAAIDHLRQLTSELPKDEEIYIQTVSYLREAGREAEVRRESFLRSLGNPNDARSRIDLIYSLHKEGNETAVKANVEEILHDFANNPAALMALADFAANTGDAALARRIYEYSKLRRFDYEGAGLMAIEANIVSGQYQAALELVRDLLKENPSWNRRYASVFNGLQAIAHYGLGDAESAQLFLNNFLNQTTIRAENLVAVSKRLLAVGAKSQARQVLVQAVKSDPLNQSALTSLIKLDLELNNTDTLATSVGQLLAMRKPSVEILDAAYRKLGSDLFLFAPNRSALLTNLRGAIETAHTRS
jgi:Tfp pilus assembly protein PilF